MIVGLIASATVASHCVRVIVSPTVRPVRDAGRLVYSRSRAITGSARPLEMGVSTRGDAPPRQPPCALAHARTECEAHSAKPARVKTPDNLSRCEPDHSGTRSAVDYG